jgi:hypothetical protein
MRQPGAWQTGSVPDCVRAFSAGKPLVLRNPAQFAPGSTQPHEAVHARSMHRGAARVASAAGHRPALDWTAVSYRRQQDGASARDLCLDQIQRYQKQDGR